MESREGKVVCSNQSSSSYSGLTLLLLFFLSFPTIHLVGEQPKILVLDKGLVFLHFVL